MKSYPPIDSITSKGQLAKLYRVHRNTMSKWLKKHGLQFPNRRLLPEDVKKVIDTFGPPPRNESEVVLYIASKNNSLQD